MPQFKCLECSNTNFGTPRLLDTSGYTRCENCNIGLVWKSPRFSRNVEPVRTYVPIGATRSPKTGRILEPSRITKGSRFFIRIFSVIPPLARERLERRKRREGTLKEDRGF